MSNNLTRLKLIAGWKPDFREAQKYLRLFRVETQKYLRPLQRDPEVPAVVPLPTPRSTCGVGRMLVAWSSHCHRSTCWQSRLGAEKREERLSAALSELPSPAVAPRQPEADSYCFSELQSPRHIVLDFALAETHWSRFCTRQDTLVSILHSPRHIVLDFGVSRRRDKFRIRPLCTVLC